MCRRHVDRFIVAECMIDYFGQGAPGLCNRRCPPAQPPEVLPQVLAPRVFRDLDCQKGSGLECRPVARRIGPSLPRRVSAGYDRTASRSEPGFVRSQPSCRASPELEEACRPCPSSGLVDRGPSDRPDPARQAIHFPPFGFVITPVRAEPSAEPVNLCLGHRFGRQVREGQLHGVRAVARDPQPEPGGPDRDVFWTMLQARIEQAPSPPGSRPFGSPGSLDRARRDHHWEPADRPRRDTRERFRPDLA